MDFAKRTEQLLHFIDNSPSAYQAVENLKQMLLQAEYQELTEAQDWKLISGGKYFVTRNDSTIAAFHIPKKEDLQNITGFHMVAAHSDSPSFKIKESPEMKVEDKYVKLNTERYGGMLMSTWFDRPLSVAGRIVVKEKDKLVSRLVNVERELLVIPSVAIHMNRDANSKTEYNAQTDLLPLYGEAGEKNTFWETVGAAAGVKEEDILAHDLFLYAREKGKRIGGQGEYVLSPRLDDLQCTFAAITAMTESTPKDYINICVVFDNEEVGSGTRQGADSTFLQDVLARIQEGLALKSSFLRQKLTESFLISADNAHAVHPNHPEKADPTNRPYLNGGIVLKYHGSQKYTTDAVTAAVIKELCKEVEVPVQIYTNRSDMAGGSTLGNISTAHVSVPSADIGLPQLAMHSAVETAGNKDTEYAVRMFQAFYAK